MRSIRLLLAALLATLGSCATPTTVVAPVAFTLAEAADSIPVPYGKTVTINNVLLTFAGVPADSRCPTRVVCVTAGDATVSTTVTLACTRSRPACAVPEVLLDLHTNVEPRAGVYGGLEIRLLALRPVPELPGPIRQAQYVAWYRIRAAAN